MRPRVHAAESAVIVVLEMNALQADDCGIFSPDRVAGQLWPKLVGN